MIKNQLSQSISNFFVLITAPHAFCPKKIIPGKHECDFRALNIANLLAKMLRKKNIEFRIIYSEVLRSNVDFNRNKLDLTPSNNSSIEEWDKFQQTILKTIVSTSTKKILLLDIHSFPNINSFCKKGKNDCYITILDVYNKNRPELRQFAKTSEMPFTVNVEPGGKNYIINTYGDIHIPASTNTIYPILLEFIENTTLLSDEQIELFFNKLLEFPFL